MLEIVKTHTSSETTWDFESDQEILLHTCIECSIRKDGEAIGTAQIFLMDFDEDGEPAVAYVGSLTIAEAERCKGYGTQVLTQLAAEYGGIYLCPENERCAHLYERLGDDVTDDCPECLQGDADEYGKTFYIE